MAKLTSVNSKNLSNDSRHATIQDPNLKKKNRLVFLSLGVSCSIILIMIFIGFLLVFVLPPRHLVVSINDVKYTRGDLVETVRVNKTTEIFLGPDADKGSTIFDTLQKIVENEIISQSAPSYGVSVTNSEIDSIIEYVMQSTEDQNSGKTKQQIQLETRERYLRYLNQVQVDEDSHKEQLRKALLREKMKQWSGETVPYVAEQVHLFRMLIPLSGEYEIMQTNYSDAVKNALTSEDYEDAFKYLAKEFSVDDPIMIRQGGDMGWVPKGVIEYERDFFDLEIGELSDPIKNKDNPSTMIFFMVSDKQTAAELDQSMREKLKTNALQKWVNKERSRHDIFAEFNSDVYAWVGEQLKLNDRSPTPTPNPDPLQQFISSGS
ncbi:MAG: SurA N-terminal domain-containing protein [SAR202 cluster bacterium]|nr:SurA N-terminal domain-containing protein [SAR202 cluster bacterium]